MGLIEWPMWLTHVKTKHQRASTSKSFLFAAVMELWDTVRVPPIAIVRTGGTKVVCKTTEDVKKGELVVPLFFRNFGSILADSVDSTKEHPHHVEAEVTWAVSEEDKSMGQEEDEHCVALSVQPEWKLPRSRGDGQPLEWSPNDHAHPFWAIKRKEKAEDRDSLELTHQTMIFVCTCDWQKTRR
jgi:hypothetical protein